jgi:catabolite regulation protein CreA
MGRSLLLALPLVLSLAVAGTLHAEEIDCVTTEWKLLGANHKVCVSAFEDPDIPCVTCYMSQARTGGLSGAVGLAETRPNSPWTAGKPAPSPCRPSSTAKRKSFPKAPRCCSRIPRSPGCSIPSARP